MHVPKEDTDLKIENTETKKGKKSKHVKEKSSKKTSSPEKIISGRTFTLGIIIFLLAYLFGIGIAIYYFNSTAPFIIFNESIMPFPAGKVSNTFLSFSDLNGRLKAVENFYKNQDFSKIGMRIDFSTPEGQKRLKIIQKNILNKMIDDAAIEYEANSKGIVLSNEVISQEVQRTMKQYGTEEQLTQDLKETYGWSISQFEKNIVRPSLYREKLEEYFAENSPEASIAKDKIQKAYDDLKAKKNFATVATQYSDGESAKIGGELGWYSQDQMLPEISEIAFSLKKGEQSEIIRSSIGFHIISIDDIKTNNEVSMVKLRQIYVLTPVFGDWLNKIENSLPVSVWVPGLTWNKEKNKIEFTDPQMIEFYEKMRQNSQEDPSLLFY